MSNEARFRKDFRTSNPAIKTALFELLLFGLELIGLAGAGYASRLRRKTGPQGEVLIMAMPRPRQAQGYQYTPLDLGQLGGAGAATPEGRFLADVNWNVGERCRILYRETLEEMRRNGHAAARAVAQLDNPGLIDTERQQLIDDETEIRTGVEVATPLFADYEAELIRHGVAVARGGGRGGVDPDQIREACENHLAQQTRQCIEEAITTAYKEAVQVDRQNRANYFAMALRADACNLEDWINNSGIRNPNTATEKSIFKEDLKKIQRLGIWRDPNATAEEQAEMAKYETVSPNFFKFWRGVMTSSWIGSIGILAGTTLALGPASLAFYAPTVAIANLGIQKLSQFLHDRKFDAMFKEISRELKSAGPMESSVAWSGVMYTFLRDYKPYWFREDRTEFLQDAESMTVSAAMRQLKQAAAFGAGALLRKQDPDQSGSFFRDAKFNDYISQNDDAMQAIEKRWKFYTDRSKTVAKFGAGASLFCIFA